MWERKHGMPTHRCPGRGVGSGVYLYRIVTADFVAKRKLLLVR